MVNTKLHHSKENGIYYTPQVLADFLVKPLLNKAQLSVFDPAYGEGSLLLSAEREYKYKYNSSNSNIKLYGCDKLPVNGLLTHLPDSNLFEIDFLEFNNPKKFDIILMNPPYVRHHILGKNKIDYYRKKTNNICTLKRTSDLWAYFLVKSLGHLKKGGSVGAILPWSFLQADYAQTLRLWLLEQFSEIRILALGAKYFTNAKERVVLVWLKSYGEKCNSIQISSSKYINHNLKYIHVDTKKWIDNKVTFSEHNDYSQIIKEYSENYGFTYLNRFADVKIGIVTGADKYFILSLSEAKNYQIGKDDLNPIYTSSRQLSGLRMDSNRLVKYLLVFKETKTDSFKNYIKFGEEEKYNLRAHSIRRKPWYNVVVGETPDAFFPYRISKFPYLVLNTSGVQCTNSIHRLYFKNISDIQIKWIQISLLSSIGQLSIENESKTYGRGMLKIEPRSLKNSIVFCSNDNFVNTVYSEIETLLKNGDKLGSMYLATDFINKKLNIPKYLSDSTLSLLFELQSQRLDR